MKKIEGPLLEYTIMNTFNYLLSLVCLLVFSMSVQAHALSPRLWLTDDKAQMIYEVSLDGSLLSSFPTLITEDGSISFPIFPSEIDIDGQNGSLWVVSENPGRIVNFSTTGKQLMEPILTEEFGAFGPEGIAYAADESANTLFIVSDPDLELEKKPTIFEIEKDGTVINQFDHIVGTNLQLLSPQGISVDPSNGTLWITDNERKSIYHIERNGILINILLLDSALFDNPQGITVSKSDGSLWVTGRTNNTIYNLDRNNGDVISSFPTSSYDTQSKNATGIAYAPGILHIAEKISALAFGKAKLKLTKGAVIDGHVGVAANAKAYLKDSEITGTFFIDPKAKKIKLKRGVVLGENSMTTDLSHMVTTVKNIAEVASNLAATQTFGKIRDSMTIYGDPGLNVIEIKDIKLKGETLNLVCNEECSFVLNISHKMKINRNSAIKLQGNLLPKQVLFNLGKKGLAVKNHSIVRGIFITLNGKVKIDKNSQLEGAVFSGKGLKMSNSELIGIQ
ncbi:MAG: hypothetical protein ACKE51_02525 [Methylococcaceae bacterium]